MLSPKPTFKKWKTRSSSLILAMTCLLGDECLGVESLCVLFDDIQPVDAQYLLCAFANDSDGVRLTLVLCDSEPPDNEDQPLLET